MWRIRSSVIGMALVLVVAGAPSSVAAASRPLEDLTMVTAQVGWAINRATHQVMRTTDAGRVWEVVSAPHPAVQVALTSFPSATHAVVVGTRPHPMAAPRGRLGWWVWSTTNAGRTWSTTFLAGPTRRQYATHYQGYGALAAGTLTWFTPDQGWLMTVIQGVFCPSDWLYHTANGGRTWRFVDTLPAQSAQGVVFSTPTTGWMAWGQCDYGQAPVLDETRDGGTTWRPVALKRPPIVPAARNPRVGYNPQAIGLPRFATSQVGAVLTMYGGLSQNGQRVLPEFFVVYVTTDGGAHWHWTVVSRIRLVGGLSPLDRVMEPTLLRWRRSGTTWLLVVLNQYHDVIAEWPVSG